MEKLDHILHVLWTIDWFVHFQGILYLDIDSLYEDLYQQILFKFLPISELKHLAAASFGLFLHNF